MTQRRILLLESVAAQAAGLREQLAGAGFEVAVSRYEADGLKRIAEWGPEIVLLSTAHPAGDLVEFCRRLRGLAPAVLLLVASSLERERPLEEHPGLAALVDGVLPRPYGLEDLTALLHRSESEPPRSGGDARLVVTMDRDPEIVSLLRRALEPRGVEVAALPLGGLAALCARRRPALIVLDWPLDPAFIEGALPAIRGGGGTPVPVLLVSDRSPEQVAQSVPILVQAIDMFFRKPVAREPFFRVVARHLGQPELARQLAEDAAPLAAAPHAELGADALRAEFQRQLEEKYLEVEELRHRLDEATRLAAESSAEGLEWLRTENEHLREAVQAAEKRSTLALAMEQLKRSELEVKLDNLLRMKDDFERRAQDELESRVEEAARLRAELEALRAGGPREGAEPAALRAELERVLVVKERLEERLQGLEAVAAGGGVGEAARLADLEALAEQRGAQAAEAAAALADALAGAARLAEELARERRELEELRAAGQAQRDAAAADRAEEAARFEALGRELEGEREAKVRAEGTLAREIEARALAEGETRAQRECADAVGLRAEGLEARVQELEARAQGLEARAQAGEDGCAAAEAARAEAQLRVASLEEQLREEGERRAVGVAKAQELDAARAESERCAAEAEALRGQVAELGAAVERERTLRRQPEEELERVRGALAAAEKAGRDASLEQERLQAQAEGLRRALVEEASLLRQRAEYAEGQLALLRTQAGERALREEAERRASTERIGQLERELDAERAASRQLLGRLDERQEELRALQARLDAPGAPAGQPDLARIQSLLEEVIARASTDAVGNARREAELDARLQAAQEERRALQERFDRLLAETGERERRSTALLQSAIERAPGAVPAPSHDNLPAIVPEGSPPRISRRAAWVAGLALSAALAAIAAGVVLGSRRGSEAPFSRPPAVRDPGPSATAAPTPGEVWDRWTRSDGSGGVFVQATLRSEAQLRAEVEAERRSGALSAEAARVELARRLSAYRFDEAYYVSVYLKNLAPGYPPYLEDLPGRLRLRDAAGREAEAFIPPGQERELRVYSLGSGGAEERLYEAKVSVGFSRSALTPSPAYLQLVVSAVGTVSRRALTWELE